jgi:hypothetical protein
MTDYGALSHEFVDQLSSLKFRLSANGCAMEGVMEGVQITASESPLGMHFVFTRHTDRTSTQFEEKLPRSAPREVIAGMIVRTFETHFPELIRKSKEGSL